MGNLLKSFVETGDVASTQVGDDFLGRKSKLLNFKETTLKQQLKFSKYINFVGFYNGVPIWETSFCKGGEAITLPPFGIFMTPGAFNNDKDTLYHEYGHILQFYLLGDVVRFYTIIGSTSVISTQIADTHQESWSEKTANQLSYWLNGRPSDWNFSYYPVYFQ